jgi:inorganic pyrophosphatase
METKELIKKLIAANVFKAHPWHGIDLWADKSKNIVNVYIEIVPENRIKYELDKKSGYLKVDRPQKFSNIIPTLYGFLPKTYSDTHSANYTMKKLGRNDLVGDHDPVDICVLTEKNIKHGDILLEAIPIGGFRMIDGGEVDDKIIAVLKDDAVYGDYTSIEQVPAKVLESLKHYFLTYKELPKPTNSTVEITDTYGMEEALRIIDVSEKDYNENFDV